MVELSVMSFDNDETMSYHCSTASSDLYTKGCALRSVCLAAILFSLITGCTRVSPPTRPVYDGFALAVPDSLPPEAPISDHYNPFTETLVYLDIDSTGHVSRVQAADTVQVKLADTVRTYFFELAFLPALDKGAPVASKLPVEVVYNYPGTCLRARFPVVRNEWAVYANLYGKALKMNERAVPELVTVPPYYTDILTNDLYYRTPYRLYQVKLDSLARPVSIVSMGGSYPDFDHHFRTALNWSEYSIGVIPKSDSLSTLYVVFAVYPGLKYPTAPYSFENTDRMSVLNRHRIRVFADTLGEMLPPMPYKSSRMEIPIKKTRLPVNRGPWTGLVKIDTSGRGTLLSRYFQQGQVRQAYKQLLQLDRFYPAIDFHGRPHEFEGLAYLTLTSDTTIRVEFGWLSDIP